MAKKFALLIAFVLLLLTTALASCFGSAKQDRTPREGARFSNATQVVFGVELTMDEVICSASLSNGTIVNLASVDGGYHYHSVMQRLFEWCETAAERQHIPYPCERSSRWDKDVRQWLSVPNCQDRHFPFRNITTQHGLPAMREEIAGVVGEAISRAREASLETLETQYGIPLNSLGPFAQVAIPTFLFTTISQTQPLGMLEWPIWRMFEMDDTSPSIWYRNIIDAIKDAIYEGGFRTMARTGLFGDEWPWPGYLPYDAASYAILEARHHELNYTEHGKPPEEWSRSLAHSVCNHGGNTIVVVDISKHVVSVHAIGKGDCFLEWAPWTTYQQLQPSVFNSSNAVADWTDQLRDEISLLIESARPNFPTVDHITIVPTGTGWSREVLEDMTQSVPRWGEDITFLPLQHAKWLASMGAAEQARLDVCDSWHEFYRPTADLSVNQPTPILQLSPPEWFPHNETAMTKKAQESIAFSLSKRLSSMSAAPTSAPTRTCQHGDWKCATRRQRYTEMVKRDSKPSGTSRPTTPSRSPG